MNDTPDDTLPKRRRSAQRKGTKPRVITNEPAVQAILDHAMQADTPPDDEAAQGPAAASLGVPKPTAKRRPPRKRAKKPVSPPAAAQEPAVVQPPPETALQSVVEPVEEVEQVEPIEPIEPGRDDISEPAQTPAEPPADHDERAFVDLPPEEDLPPHDGHAPPSTIPHEPSHHHWVYLGLAVFLLALGFGLWGVWTTWFAGDTSASEGAALRARSEKLSQEVSTLRRSDQISREANRDLERTLAERDEEIAGLRADIAFYERFVGATGQRRGLSVHALEMQLQGGDAWHFVATLTQNLNRGAVNTGRVTLLVEGTRNDRLEKLSWSGLRKQTNAPGVAYSFKYFQQVEGEVMLPKDFTPLRVTVRLVPAGGSAVEQSFPWPDTVRGGG